MKLQGKGRPRWTPNRNHPLSPHQRKKRKRAEADARTAAYRALSSIEKLALIAMRPGESNRERARLGRVSP